MGTEICKSNLWAVKDLAMMAELQNQELKRRLSLYQVFLKLYEQHSTLLDEILQLESCQPRSNLLKVRYVQGVVNDSTVYLISNLSNQTQTLQQPQQIWTIGRDRSSGICVANQYLSRRHAAIQYIDNEGFYLIDFKSTNGSFVNRKRTHQPVKLEDGDRIRLGGMTFDFFLSNSSRILPTVAMELLMQLKSQVGGTKETLGMAGKLQKPRSENLDNIVQIFKDHNLIENLDDGNGNLNARLQSEILDRFFSRSTQCNPVLKILMNDDL